MAVAIEGLNCSSRKSNIEKVSASDVKQQSLANTLLSIWATDHNLYLRDYSNQLGLEAIQFGLLGLWQQIYLDQISCNQEPPKEQIEKTEIISNNALSLIQEIISKDNKKDRSIQNDIRLLGLIALCISRSEQLPRDLLQNLSLHREAVDIFAISLLHTRSFSIATLLANYAPQLSGISRAFESISTYIDLLVDPTKHRADIITDTPAIFITPWPQLTLLLKDLAITSGLLHDYKYNQALDKCEELIASYPSCPEVRRLYLVSSYFAHKSCKIIFSDKINQIDPLLLHSSDSFLFTPFERLIYLSQFQDKSIEQICFPKDLPRLGLDSKFYETRSQLQLQLTHNKKTGLDLEKLASTYTDQLMRTSGYDPFKLALYSAQLKKLDGSIVESTSIELEPSLPCDLMFVIGLPSPHWSQLKELLSSVEKYAVFDSTILLNKLCDQFPDVIGANYPVTLDKLTSENISKFRLSYLQNLAVCFGGQDKAMLIDFLPNNFEHIGMLALAFPECNFLAIHPTMRESILSSYLEINGFSSSHATPTLSELTAYCYDYAEILENWNTILKSRLRVINFSSMTIGSEIQSLKDLFKDIDISFEPKLPYGAFVSTKICDTYKFLNDGIQEFDEEISDSEKILSELASI